MTDSLKRNRASGIVQASAAVVADAFSSGAQTDFYTTSTGTGLNCNGCDEADIEIDVTVAPSSAALCEIYVESLQFDGVGYSAPKLVQHVALTTAADKYHARVDQLPEKGRIIIKAIDFGFTASVSMSGIYYSDT